MAGIVAAAVALVAVALGSLALGSAELEVGAVFGAFTAFDGSNAHLIVSELRLPRTLLGIAASASRTGSVPARCWRRCSPR
jgi:iron complex transport system permease protein